MLIASVHVLSEPTANEGTKTMLLERQKEYKMAALRAKKQGDLEQARLYLRTSKVCKKTLHVVIIVFFSYFKFCCKICPMFIHQKSVMKLNQVKPSSTSILLIVLF